MKTYRPLFLALIVSAVLAVTVQAGPRHGNGGSQVASAPARAAAPAYRSGSRYYGGGRMIAPSQRFSSTRMRSNPTAFQRRYVNSNASLNARRITPGNFNRGNNFARSGGNHGNHGNAIGNSNRRAGGNNNHVFARHTADRHRDWDRHHDHWWHGHRCRFVNGYWFIFDLGFSPWYGYPYDYYYPSGYYYGDPYGYDASVYDSGAYEESAPNYDNNDGKDSYDSSNQNGDSSVAAAQERLSKQGYYRGQIDGVFGPETSRAIRNFQSEHGLRATGYLTTDTLQALGLGRAAGR